MASSNLLELFDSQLPPRPDPDLALRASFGLQDVERWVRENAALRAENKVLRGKLRDIGALVALWPR